MMLDIIGIVLIILFFIRGYMRGMIVAVFSLLGYVLGAMCALMLSHKLAQYFYDKGIITSGWGQVVSYILLFIVVVIIVRWLGKLIGGALEAVMLGGVNKIIGGVLYVCLALVLWSSALWLGNQMHLISDETKVSSKTYTTFVSIAPWIFEQIGKVIPFAKDVFHDLQQFFEHVNQKLPEHVGTH